MVVAAVALQYSLGRDENLWLKLFKDSLVGKKKHINCPSGLEDGYK